MMVGAPLENWYCVSSAIAVNDVPMLTCRCVGLHLVSQKLHVYVSVDTRGGGRQARTTVFVQICSRVESLDLNQALSGSVTMTVLVLSFRIVMAVNPSGSHTFGV